MDVSKYVTTGQEIKKLGLKLQGIVDPESLSEQEQLLIRPLETEDRASGKGSNVGAVVAGILFALVIGTFILLHFW
ncbi:hypothetical protein [Fusibacter ferrireducens]|uniref:Tetrahydromethanopterin S-methyltransferase n=1 Tax=Fusibacter ferrireducens TaxID=2785058 RepID=A0ABR9ZY18_9FIRM|nr:hypothetical protein [Fusibacter ferrireducens]MBF4695364.1 hypothetical protein [Fusibacter ferrireducens]